MSVDGYLRAVPKAELHVHLEGSIQPPTLLALAKRNHVSLPADTVEGLQKWFVYSGFDHFVEVYVAVNRCLKTVEDFELITYEFGTEMARQNIRYAEVTFTPSNHYRVGVAQDTYIAGLVVGRDRVKRELGVEINWVFDIDRSSKHADYSTGVAIEGIKDGVVALGLGGPEIGYPPERFAQWFNKARAAGLHSVPHAGETGGPDSIWGALRALGAERIGHGVRSIEDPELIAYLAERNLPLEVCPTSNVQIGTYAGLADHPMRRLHEAGVTVTVNSDDPPLFNTTLNDEVVALDQAFRFDLATVDEILLNGLRHSFLSEERKKRLEEEFRTEMAALRAVHLGVRQLDRSRMDNQSICNNGNDSERREGSGR